LLQRHLSLTDVVVALHLPGDLVLGLAGFGFGLVLRALGLVLGLVADALGLASDLVLGLGALFLRLVPSLGGLLLGLVPRLGRLLLHGVLGLGGFLLDRLVVVRSDGRRGAPREPQRDGQCGDGELTHGVSSSPGCRCKTDTSGRGPQAFRISSAIFFTSAAST